MKDNNYYNFDDYNVFEDTDGYSRKKHFFSSEPKRDTQNLFCKKTPQSWTTMLYFPIAIFWMEMILKLATGLSVFGGFFFTLLFTIPLSLVLTVVCTISGRSKLNRCISLGITAVFAIWYSTQVVYNNVFGIFMVVSSITNGGTGQAFNSIDMIMTSIWNKLFFIVLIFAPLILGIVTGKRFFAFKKTGLQLKGILLAAAIAIQIITLIFINFDSGSTDTKSNYNLYNGELQQNSACDRFGMFTMQRIDISRLIFGYKSNIKIVADNTQPATESGTGNLTEKKPEPHIIDTDFKALAENSSDEDLQTLYEYFDSASPSYTNEYTGMFKDYNIIFLTAESFSQYAIDEKYTPTLYKMYKEGFQFENYYSPAWGVSTTDGEYANLTGLIPKSGVWSFSESAENNISFPFTLGEESHVYNYQTINAYHNHTYDYYDRDKYLTNIGYDYSAIGKGLDLGENVWPNSDLKMMEKTVDDYINSDSFSVYYMTVSGHGGYSYNTISERNAELVEELDYSDEVKGYIAANIELDKAMEYLIQRLDKAGKLDNTLICLTDDHYPYSLDDFNGLDELAGHTVDTTFERYKNAWLLWSGSMKEPVKVDTYCSSLDILPTLLNMLGFEYDSRTLAGTDVFGNKEPFVVMGDRSWISQNGMYNANTGEYTQFENAKGTDDIDTLNTKCSNMFTISRMILDTNVYAEMYGDTHVVGS